MKEDKTVYHNSEPLERVYINYEPKKNLPNNEDIMHKQREKDINSFASSVCVTTKANHNLTPSQKELL